MGEHGIQEDSPAGRAWFEQWSDPVKLEIAARLRRETTLSIKAIAARVQLGSSKAANRSLHSYMRGGAAARLDLHN